MAVKRTQHCAASPEKVWARVFESFQWHEWDPDINHVDHEGQSFEEGATVTIVMKNGLRGQTSLHRVAPYTLFVYRGSFWHGSLGYEASFSIQPTAADDTCQISYEFGLSGMLGWFTTKANEKIILHGVEEGLKNMVRLAEEAQESTDATQPSGMKRRFRRQRRRISWLHVLTVAVLIVAVLLTAIVFLLMQLHQATTRGVEPPPAPPPLESTTLQLLTKPSLCNISTDVRGNLGPAEVMLQNGTDWIKDRWQAASNMHGKAIQGTHWVQLNFEKTVKLSKVVLDWEAAFSDSYRMQYLDPAAGFYRDVYAVPGSKIQVATVGQSPGVKEKTPLHVIHLHRLSALSVGAKSFRLLIERSAMGWGVSLWQIKLFGVILDD